jgi:hypothetical protein
MRVFISHAADGAEIASEVARSLRRQGLEVWFGQSEILPGDNWADQVSRALRESQAMVVLFTPQAVNSPNVQWEIGFALGAREYRGRLIPVLVGSPDQMPVEVLPGVLQRMNHLRLNGAAEIPDLVHQIVHTSLAAA